MCSGLSRGAIATRTYTGGRKQGFSIEEFLRSKGVTTTEGMRAHKALIFGTIQSNPSFSIIGYRVDANNPNVPLMG